MSTGDQFTRARELFDELVELPDDEREAFLNERCGADTALREEVSSLLDAGARAGEFLAGSAIPTMAGAEVWLGKQVGGYRLERVIACGGMGIVFEARQDQPRRQVALKLIRGDVLTRRVLQRFELEAELLGRLDHPGIARIYDAGTTGASTGRQPYFVMELVDGRPLTTFAREEELSTSGRIELMIRICDAVNHAHQQGIVHRDLKPANILVRADGQPKILDFGIARQTDSDLQMTTRQTGAGEVLGTLPYMSPEQVRGRRSELDTRSDVYALGVLCHELLTDQLPQRLEGLSLLEAVQIIEQEAPRSLSDHGRHFSADLETIVRKCLEKEKTRRYGSPGEFAHDLRRFLSDQPILARPPSTLYQLQKLARRHRGVVVAGVAGLVILVAGFVVAISGWKRADRLRVQAEIEMQKSHVLSDFMVTLLESPDPWEDGTDVRVVDVLKNASAVIEDRLAGEPEVAASAHVALANTYRGIGAYDDAEQNLQAALAVLGGVASPFDLRRYSPLESLGDLYLDQGRLGAADSIAAEIEAFIPHLPEGGPEHVDALHYLGGLEEAHGRLDEAINYLRVAHHHATEQPSGMAFVVEAALGNLLWQVDRASEAQPLLESAAKAGAEARGPDDPEVLGLMNNLAFVYQANGESEAALDTFQQVLATKIRVLGPEHPSTAIGHHSVAHQLRTMGRIDEALVNHERAIAIAVGALGEADIRTCVFRAGHGTTLFEAGRFDEAEAALLASYRGLRELVGEDNPRTRRVASTLADTYEKIGKTARANEFRARAETATPPEK